MHKRKFFYSLLIIILAIIIYELKVIGFINLENIQIFIQNFGILAPIAYILLYIFLILIGFSSGVLTVIAGILFNPYLAFLTVMIASIIGASIAFLIGRKYSNKFHKTKFAKNKKIKEIFEKLNKNANKHGFISIMTLRIAFVPYIWLSYLSGIIKDMKFRPFILATLLTNLFGAFLYIFLGFSITQNLPIFFGAIILLIIIIIGLRIYHKKIEK